MRMLVVAGALVLAGCGGSDEQAAPGLYLVSLDGKREFVTDDVGAVERWKKARS
jgi:hypothetical protein